MSRPWSLELTNLSLGGFAPNWYFDAYPTYGNKNMAGDMENVDMLHQSYITQGPGMTDLTNGNQSGVVSTVMKQMIATAATVAYGVGGNKLYQIATTAGTAGQVVSSGTWPHTIDKAAVTAEDGLGLVSFRGDLYYIYNHSGSSGDIGKYDFSSTFDDDWGSTVPSGAGSLTSSLYRPIAVGGNDTFAFGNGRYVGTFDGTTLQLQALDLPTGYTVTDIKWLNDKWWITTVNIDRSSVFIWDGTTDSWEQEIKLPGNSFGAYVKNNVFYTFFYDPSGYNKMCYIDGNKLVDLCTFPEGTKNYGLPETYQIADYKDFIIWRSDNKVYAFGSGHKDLPARLFQYGKMVADADFTAGGILVPIHSSGTTIARAPLVASGDFGGTTFRLARFLNYDTDCSWKSLNYTIAGQDRDYSVDSIRINFEKLASGARVDWSLVDNKGVTLYSDTISFAKLGAVSTAWYNFAGKNWENFRVQFDWSNGSTTAPVSIKSVQIYGTR